MTADRREYSRKPPGFPDMSVPPPGTGMLPPPPQFDMPPPGYPSEPAPYFPHPAEVVDPYYQSYEPTQDRQWGGDPVRVGTSILFIYSSDFTPFPRHTSQFI